MEPEPLSIVDKDSYLLVEFFGEFSVEAGKKCVDRMTEACEEHDRSSVLLDCRRMTGEMSVMARFQVTEYGATKRLQIRRIALLNREEVLLPDNFVENVAVNRGMNLRSFTEFDEAEFWITDGVTKELDAVEDE